MWALREPVLGEDVYDYLIIGAGSAGCVLANRLSADPKVRVALLEAGGRDDWHWIHIPSGTREVVGNPRTDWCYTSELEPMLGRAAPVFRGKVLGGSSSINGTVYQRGAAADYERWRQMGLTGWGWNDVLPYFKRSERFVEGEGPFHGGAGELNVEHARFECETFDLLTRAAEEIGIAARADFNCGDLEGCGVWDVKQRNGVRVSASSAFLRPIRHRANLNIMTEAMCTRLVFEGARVCGVEAFFGAAPRSLRARREVILCAGAIGSAQLLQVSGVGPGEILRKAGVEVRHELPGVGANLQDHTSMRFAYKVRGVETVNTRYHNLFKRALMGAEYALMRRGPMVMGAPFWGGYTRSDQGRAEPNLQFLAMPASMSASFSEPDRFDAISGGVYNLHPRSRGHVWITSPDPRKQPAILHNYLTDPDDQQVAIDSLKLMRRLFNAPALQALSPEELRPGPEAASDEQLLEAGLRTAGSAYHQCCTCAMGTDDMAVVDVRLRARGLENLRIADGSVLPNLISGSTGTCIMMIAEKAAEMIVEDARCA